jgi:hypothetical protein
MPVYRKLADRNRDREDAKAKQRALRERATHAATERLVAKRRTGTTETAQLPARATESCAAPTAAATPEAPTFIAPRLLDHQAGDLQAHLQPWSTDLAKALLARALDNGLSLRLLWPLEVDDLVVLHAVASLSRVFEKDLQGLRTLYYPGSNTTRLALDDVSIDRKQLQSLCHSLWEDIETLKDIRAKRRSASFEAVLTACNFIEVYQSGERSPQLRELIPTFIYDPKTKSWQSTKIQPLERVLRTVSKLRRREILREQIGTEWTELRLAPGALFVLPRRLKRKDQKLALAQGRRAPNVCPDVLLFDATTRSLNADQNAVRRIPEFLKIAYDVIGRQVGGLIVTDDPVMYFVLRHQLANHNIHTDASVLAAESDEPHALIAREPMAPDWRPKSRSAVNFSVSILDRDAATLARRLGRIALRSSSVTPSRS